MMRNLIALFLVVGALAAVAPRPAYAVPIVLDPANFTIETAKNPPTATALFGSMVRVSDPADDDFITLFAAAPIITAGSSLDLIVRFRVLVLPTDSRQGGG